MRDFNEFLIEQDEQLFTEIFGAIKNAVMGKTPEWVSYLKKLEAGQSGPIATLLLRMFTKGVDQQAYQWMKANQNSVFQFLTQHRNNLEGMGMPIDGLIKKLGLYDPTDLATQQSGKAGWLGNKNVAGHDMAQGNVKIPR